MMRTATEQTGQKKFKSYNGEGQGKTLMEGCSSYDWANSQHNTTRAGDDNSREGEEEVKEAPVELNLCLYC